MVSPSEWGPNAWELLHGIAERVGRHKHPAMVRDEQVGLRMTLLHLWALLPCQTCQKHYREWHRVKKPDVFLTRYGETLRQELRSWLYNLHEDVNHRRNIVSSVDLASLSERYKAVDLRKEALKLKAFFTRGIQSGVLKPEEWKAAWRHLDGLLRFIGA